jgi:hypothetical protein
MDVGDQTVSNYYSPSSRHPTSYYRYLVAGPGTVYQNCGQFVDELTVDNGVLTTMSTVNNIEVRSNYILPKEFTAQLAPNTLSSFKVNHLRMLNGVVISAELAVNGITEFGKISGDQSCQLVVPPQTTVILGNYKNMQTSTEILSATQLINPFEMVVTKKVKYIVNDMSGISTNILVRENGKLVVPGNLTLYNGASLVVHGHLLGAETLLIYGDATVDLKMTAQHINSISESVSKAVLEDNEYWNYNILYDEKKVNQFYFHDLVLIGGGKLRLESAGATCMGSDGATTCGPHNANAATCVSVNGADSNTCVYVAAADQPACGLHVTNQLRVGGQSNEIYGLTTIDGLLEIKGVLNMTVSTLIVTDTGKISGEGRGYGAERGPGYFSNHGSGNAYYIGGSHGGRGGLQKKWSLVNGGDYNGYRYNRWEYEAGVLESQARTTYGKQGGSYGSYKQPTTRGSGGALHDLLARFMAQCGIAGSGGAALKIDATSDVLNNGIISMNGADGCALANSPPYNYYDNKRSTGGGAGGSVWLTTPHFHGSGIIRANGGSTPRPIQLTGGAPLTTVGGTGGGGRIALYCSQSNYTGNISAKSGNLDSMYTLMNIHKTQCGGGGTIYQNCGEEVDRLSVDGSLTCPSPFPKQLFQNVSQLHLGALSLDKGSVLKMQDDQLPVAISVEDLTGDSSGGSMTLGRGQVLVVRGKLLNPDRSYDGKKIIRPLPYTSASLTQEGVVVIAVATVAYMGNTSEPGFDLTVPFGATVIFPPMVWVKNQIQIGGHMAGIRTIIIAGNKGRFQVLPSATGNDMLTFQSIFITDGGEMVVGPFGGTTTLTVNKLSVGMDNANSDIATLRMLGPSQICTRNDVLSPTGSSGIYYSEVYTCPGNTEIESNYTLNVEQMSVTARGHITASAVEFSGDQNVVDDLCSTYTTIYNCHQIPKCQWGKQLYLGQAYRCFLRDTVFHGPANLIINVGGFFTHSGTISARGVFSNLLSKDRDGGDSAGNNPVLYGSVSGKIIVHAPSIVGNGKFTTLTGCYDKTNDLSEDSVDVSGSTFGRCNPNFEDSGVVLACSDISKTWIGNVLSKWGGNSGEDLVATRPTPVTGDTCTDVSGRRLGSSSSPYFKSLVHRAVVNATNGVIFNARNQPIRCPTGYH